MAVAVLANMSILHADPKTKQGGRELPQVKLSPYCRWREQCHMAALTEREVEASFLVEQDAIL